MAEETKKVAAKKPAAAKKTTTTKRQTAKVEAKSASAEVKKPVVKKSTSKKAPKVEKKASVARENHRKILVGTVISIKNAKTATVLVETYEKHPLYAKRFKKSKKFAVHDENNIAKIGDVVKIQETRPLSKTKHFRLVEVRSHAIGGNDNA